MEGPTRAALEEILADLEQMPQSEERDQAIAKVRRQLEALGISTEGSESASVVPRGAE